MGGGGDGGGGGGEGGGCRAKNKNPTKMWGTTRPVFEEASDLEVSVAVLVAAHAQVGPRASMTSGNSCGEG